MAFSFNNVSHLKTTDNPATIDHTCGENSKLLVLCIISDETEASSGTPTYDGNNMTQVNSLVVAEETSVEIWYYLDPVDSQQKTISVPNAYALGLRLVVTDYLNAGADAQFSGSASQSTTTNNPSCTITGVLDGSVCVDCNGHGEKDAHQASSHNHLIDDGTPGEYSYDEGAYQSAAQYSIKSGTGDQTHYYEADGYPTGGSDDSCMLMGAWEEYTVVMEYLAGVIDVAITTAAALSTKIPLAGQSDVALSVSGALSAKKPVAGQADIATSTTAALSRTASLAGQSDVSVSTSGNLQIKTSIAGQSDVSVTTSAAISLKKGLAGQSDVAVTTAGNVVRGRRLSGQSDVSVSTSGVLSAEKKLAGQADVAITTSAELTVKVVESLQGQADVSITTSATLSRKRGLSVSLATPWTAKKRKIAAGMPFMPTPPLPDGTVGVEDRAALVGVYYVTKAYIIQITTAGHLEVSKPLSGQADVSVSVSGILSATKPLAGEANVAVSTTAELTITSKVMLQGSVDVTLSTAGAISVGRKLAGESSVAIECTANLSVSGMVPLAAVVDLTTACAGTLSIQRSLIGAAAIQITTEGALGLRFALKGTSDIVITSNGTMSLTRQLAGTADVMVNALARLTGLWSLKGAATVQIQTEAQLKEVVKVAWLLGINVSHINSILTRV